jgi:hypothetical protein
MNENTVVIIKGRSVSPAFIDLVDELTSYFDIGEDNSLQKDELFEFMHHVLFYMRTEDLDIEFKKIAQAAFYLYRFADKLEKIQIASRNPKTNMPMGNI